MSTPVIAEIYRNDTSDFLAKNYGTSDLSRRVSSSSSSSAISSRPSSSGQRFSSIAPQSMPASEERQSRPANEATPIISNNGSTTRDYQSTGGSRNRDPGTETDRTKNTPTQGGQSSDDHADSTTEEHSSWTSRLADRFGSLELENKGSVARDHLALERTFLAWLRTSLAFASIGIAVTQIFRLNSSAGSRNVDMTGAFPPLLSPALYDPAAITVTSTPSRLRAVGKPLGATFIGVAILVLLMGFHRYFESQHWIIRGKFPASRGSVAIIAFVTAALIVAALVVILAISPGAIET